MKIFRNKKYRKIKGRRRGRSGAGFTLLELIVAMAVIVILSSLFVANYQGAKKKSALKLEAHKFVGDLRRAQNMALGAYQFNASGVPDAWGIYLTPTQSFQYIIFADLNDNKVYNSGIDGILETVAFDNNITFAISAIRNISFTPPDPLTYINGANSGSITITLQNNIGETKNILINYLGLIDIED